MKNVLVFPCGSGVAIEFYNSVKYSPHFHVIGANSEHDHGEFVFDDYIGNVPRYDAEDFIKVIKRIVTDRNVDAIFPAMDVVFSLLKKNEDYLGCKVLGSCLQTVEMCMSKHKTYEALKNTIRVPKEYSVDEINQFPVFMKPDVGYGSRGARKIENKTELLEYVDSNPDYLILEYLPGDEYTVDCFTDRNRNLLYCRARVRNRIMNGISVNTAFVDDQGEFEGLAQKINESIELRGAWFFQVKYDTNGELCLMEVASRFGGSSALSRAIGVNFALLTLFDAFDSDVSIETNEYGIEFDRTLDYKFKMDLEFDRVYIDYDDCVILNGDIVNLSMIRFLYKCINEGKKVTLLTKHSGILADELKRFRIEQIFDEVIHIDKSENKSEYINSDEKFIFIDDSFSERSNVKQRYGCSVFSVDMVDLLY